MKPKSTRLAFIEPQLATLKKSAPNGKEWIHETKFDGYRIQAHINGMDVKLLTRNKQNWTDRFPRIARALQTLTHTTAVLDGELIAITDSKGGSFTALQHLSEYPDAVIVYYVFDILHLNGKDLRKETQLKRKEILDSLVKGHHSSIRISQYSRGNGSRVLKDACDRKLEGIISKVADAPYRSGRGTTWLKSKCVGNDEFLIIGFRNSTVKGRPFSSLILGEIVRNKLVYRGRVGTGFNDATLKKLSDKMFAISRTTSPLKEIPDEERRGANWVRPKLLAQIGYTEMTKDGRLRHPRYLGLREDKS